VSVAEPIDPRDRFSGAADDYARYRPGYPAALVDWILADAGVGPGDPVADVGCGTGIFTRLLAERGLDVVGIDPNEDMLAAARATGGGPRYARGEAGATGLADASVALVTVAQAFHWFAVDAALAELRRVLRPGRRVATAWNLRTGGDFLDEYDGVLRRFSREYGGVVERWDRSVDRLRAHPGVADGRDFETTNAQVFDLPGLLGRASSSSYVIHGVADREGLEAALTRVFEKHARDGRVEFRYRSIAFAFAPRPA
jgi:SAM-dependent methyltransferase